MRILVTGGAGFIGRALARRLLDDGYQVRILDILSPQIHGDDPSVPAECIGAEFLVGDVRDSALVRRALVGVSAVAHLAGETGVGQSMYEIERYVSVNELGTASLIQAMAERDEPFTRLVLSSSRAVYGEGRYNCGTCGVVRPLPRHRMDIGDWEPECPVCGEPVEDLPTPEDSAPSPGSIYAVTKLGQEHLVRAVGSAYQIPSVVLRYFNVYGPGQSLKNPYTGILSTFYNRAVDGERIEVFEDGHESRDFVYIDDVVEATVLALTTPAEQVGGHDFNVGFGKAITILALAELVRELVNTASEIYVTGAYRVGDIRHATADTDKARKILRFQARVPITQGLQEWVQWAAIEQSKGTGQLGAAQDELAARGLYRKSGERT